MAKGRWLYTNLIESADMLTLSSAVTGVVGSPMAQAQGSAVFSPPRATTPAAARKYTPCR